MSLCDSVANEWVSNVGDEPWPTPLLEHVESCHHCQTILADYDSLVATVEPLPETLGARVSLPRLQRRLVPRAVAWAATLAVGLLLGALGARWMPSSSARTRVQLTSTLAVHPWAQARVQYQAKAQRLLLEDGDIEVHFHPPKPEPLAVETPGGRVEVLGTVFSVVWEPQARALTATVQSGKVRVIPNAGAPVELLAGEKFFAAELPTRAFAAEQKTNINEAPKVRAKAPPNKASTLATTEDLYAELDALLLHKRYAEAAAWLETHMEAAREPLASLIRLELGKLYTHHLKNKAAATRVLTPLTSRQDSTGEAALELLQTK